MTKNECYAEIDRCNAIIGQDQNLINQLNTDISELKTTETKVDSLRAVLSTCKSSSATKLGNTSSYSRINTKIVTKIFRNMDELLQGMSYQNSYNGLGSALGVIGNEINNKLRQIGNLNTEINNCQNQITNMNAEIARIEAAEAAERARAEAARKAAEAKAAAAATTTSNPITSTSVKTVRTTTTKVSSSKRKKKK